MTRPKRRLGGESLFWTRRAHNQQFVLVPSPELNQLLGYALALYATRYNIHVHGFVAMSNHLHAVSTDPDAQMSSFLRCFFSLVSRLRNRQLERQDSLWSAQSPHEVVVLDEAAMRDTLLYTLLNPVKAHLVETAEEWEGLVLGPKDWGRTLTFERPECLNEARTTLPETASLTVVPPPLFGRQQPWSAQEFDERLDVRQTQLAQEREATGRTVCGMAALYGLTAQDTPRTWRARMDAEQASGSSSAPAGANDDAEAEAPTSVVAHMCWWRRTTSTGRPTRTYFAGAPELVETAMEELRAFWRAHAEARAALGEELGEREPTPWPDGTIGLVYVLGAAPTEPQPEPEGTSHRSKHAA